MARYHASITGIERKARALLSKMTLDEKLAQLGGVWSNELLGDDGKFSVEKGRNVIKHGIGQISRPATATSLSLEELVSFINEIQRFLVEKTRLGVPAIMHEECLNGFMARGAPPLAPTGFLPGSS